MHNVIHGASGTSPPGQRGPLWQSLTVRHRYECPMRWADLDHLGHVNNVVYLDYCQEARIDMLRTHGKGPRALVEGLIVVRQEVTYHEPVDYDRHPVLVECWVSEVKGASFTVEYEIRRDRDGERVIYAHASTVLAPFHFDDGRPRRLTAEERASLLAVLEPEPESAEAPASARLNRQPTATLEPSLGGRYPLQVRFSDLDPYGHVNNVKYFEYFQEARISMVERWPGGPRGAFVIARAEVDYLEPVLFRDEPYEVRTRIDHIGNRSVTTSAEVVDGDRVVSRARIVLVSWDVARARSKEPNPGFRAALEAARDGVEPPLAS